MLQPSIDRRGCRDDGDDSGDGTSDVVEEEMMDTLAGASGGG